jgi:hypothetical protein
MIRVSIPERGKAFLQIVESDCGAQPALYLMGAGSSFSGRVADHLHVVPT